MQARVVRLEGSAGVAGRYDEGLAVAFTALVIGMLGFRVGVREKILFLNILFKHVCVKNFLFTKVSNRDALLPNHQGGSRGVAVVDLAGGGGVGVAAVVRETPDLVCCWQALQGCL